jgi:hypothetical protein
VSVHFCIAIPVSAKKARWERCGHGRAGGWRGARNWTAEDANDGQLLNLGAAAVVPPRKGPLPTGAG